MQKGEKEINNGQLNVPESTEKKSSTCEKEPDSDGLIWFHFNNKHKDICGRLRGIEEKSFMLRWPHGLSVTQRV